MKTRFLGGLLLMLFAASGAEASELRYAPINPSFGGNAFNSSHLLTTAETQNDNVEPREPTDPLANFERTITSTLLARISQDIADQILGEDAQDSGTFTIGSTVLTFQRNGDLIDINIADSSTGRNTNVQVPAPVF